MVLLGRLNVLLCEFIVSKAYPKWNSHSLFVSPLFTFYRLLPSNLKEQILDSLSKIDGVSESYPQHWGIVLVGDMHGLFLPRVKTELTCCLFHLWLKPPESVCLWCGHGWEPHTAFRGGLASRKASNVTESQLTRCRLPRQRGMIYPWSVGGYQAAQR